MRSVPSRKGRSAEPREFERFNAVPSFEFPASHCVTSGAVSMRITSRPLEGSPQWHQERRVDRGRSVVTRALLN